MKAISPIANFFITFLVAGFFFSFYSTILDYIFFDIEFGKSIRVFSSFLSYLLFFILISFPVTTLVIFFYNQAIKSFFEKKIILRLLISVLVGLVIGLIVGKNGFSYYIGKFRLEKNIILFLALCLSAEVTKILIERRKSA